MKKTSDSEKALLKCLLGCEIDRLPVKRALQLFVDNASDDDVLNDSDEFGRDVSDEGEESADGPETLQVALACAEGTSRRPRRDQSSAVLNTYLDNEDNEDNDNVVDSSTQSLPETRNNVSSAAARNPTAGVESASRRMEGFFPSDRAQSRARREQGAQRKTQLLKRTGKRAAPNSKRPPLQPAHNKRRRDDDHENDEAPCRQTMEGSLSQLVSIHEKTANRLERKDSLKRQKDLPRRGWEVDP